MFLDRRELQSCVDEDEFRPRADSRVFRSRCSLFRVPEVEFVEFVQRVLCRDISTPDARRINHPELFKFDQFQIGTVSRPFNKL